MKKKELLYLPVAFKIVSDDVRRGVSKTGLDGFSINN